MQYSSTHPSTEKTTSVREQSGIAYLLTGVAAFVDAIGFLTLQQLGVSYMSGNSMITGIALGQVNWTSFLSHGVAVLSFVVGILLGVLVLMQLKHWGTRFPFAIIFGLEGICILTVLLIGTSSLQKGIIPPSHVGAFYLCSALLPIAMGLQTATFQKIGGQGIRTTFVTGVLSDWTHHFIEYLSWIHTQATEQHLGQALRESMQQTVFRQLLLLSGIWGCYVVGAALGGALEQRLFLIALIFPLCAFVVLIVIDIVRPFDS